LKLLLATSNRGKLSEFEPFLNQKANLLTPSDSQFSGLKAPDVVEDGQTYFENALKKALQYHSVFQMPVLADDSGLEVDALNGEPGVFSARYGGESIAWAERWEKLHRALSPFPKDQWTARFRCVLCFYQGQASVPVFFFGTVEGSILPRPRGEKGFGYDPIFFSPQINKSFGEATPAEKQLFSHRSQAIRQFLSSGILDHPT
jgi:XTP/dITP diphosphohydrolase